METKPDLNDARARMAAMTRANVNELTVILSDLEDRQVNAPALRKTLRKYNLQAGTDGRFDVKSVLAALQHQRELPKNTAATSPDRARKTALECKLLEVRIAALEGEYRKEAWAEATRAGVELVTRFRSVFRGIGNAGAPIAAGTPADIPRVARIFNDLIDAALNQLADGASQLRMDKSNNQQEKQ